MNNLAAKKWEKREESRPWSSVKFMQNLLYLCFFIMLFPIIATILTITNNEV